MERADGGQVGLGQDGDLPGRDPAARHQEDGSPRGWAGETRVQVRIICILSIVDPDPWNRFTTAQSEGGLKKFKCYCSVVLVSFS